MSIRRADSDEWIVGMTMSKNSILGGTALRVVWKRAPALAIGAALISGDIFAASSAAARKLPDFTINRADSVVWGEGEGDRDDIGCGFDDFLSRGRIAIKNIGEGTATKLPGRVIFTETLVPQDPNGEDSDGLIQRGIDRVTGDEQTQQTEEEDSGPTTGVVSELFGRATGDATVTEEDLDKADQDSDGVLVRVRRSRVVARKFVWAQIFNPYNPDLSYYVATKDFGPDELEPLDQKGFTFLVGQGKLKKYRNFTGERYADDYERPKPVADPQLIDVQRALHLMGYDVDVDGVDGPRTDAAISAWQASIGAETTGELSSAERSELMRQMSHGALAGGAQGPTTKVDVFVVIDPFNLVDESNEANNIQRWSINIDCSVDDSEAFTDSFLK